MKKIAYVIMACLPCVCAANGLYVGVQPQINVTSLNYSLSSNFSSTTPLPFTNATIDEGASRRLSGFSGYLYAGYGHTFYRSYLGLEGGVDLGQASGTFQGTQFNFSPYNLTAKVKPNLTARVIAGIYVSPNTMVYGALGVQQARLRVQSNFASQNVPDFPQTNFSKKINGGLVSAGIESSINKHWSVRLQYTYIDYKNFFQSSQLQILGGTETKSANFNPSSSEFGIGLTYNFGDVFNQIQEVSLASYI